MPTWRAWLVLTSLAFGGTLLLAWKKVPDFPASASVALGEAKHAASERIGK